MRLALQNLLKMLERKMKSPLNFHLIVMLLLLFVARCHPVLGQVENPKNADASAALLEIEFPLTSTNEARILETLEKISARSSGNDRPLVILEFTKGKRESDDEAIGRKTSFERSLSLARWLSGPKGVRIKSLAYLPKSIAGHAVLVALACEEIAIATDAEIGNAGIDETNLDATVRQAYVDVTEKRNNVPVAAVLNMIDPSESLVRVDFAGADSQYSTLPQLAKTPRSEKVVQETQLGIANQLFSQTGQEMRNSRWVAHIANDREQLSQVLKLSKPVIKQTVFEGPRVAMRAHFSGIVSRGQVNRVIRALEEGLNKNEVNLVVLDVDSSGGNLNESIRLAQYLAAIPNDRVTVVSYIHSSARGDAALIPLASDLIFMHPDSKLGGPGEATLTPAVCNEQKGVLKELAKSIDRTDGELLACICPDIPLFEFNNKFDGSMQINNPEWITMDPIAPEWLQGNPVKFANGLTFEQANELGLATDNPPSIDDVGNRFGIDELPEEVRTNQTERFVEWLAGQGWLSTLLFLVGLTCLSAEFSTPGIGVAGLLSAICFLLFFWIHIFQGTVEWLEILLILAGAVCLAIELFVLPGFGVFGITGLALLAIGLLLAGQTFVIPTNEYQWQRTAQGIGQLSLIVISMFAGAIIFRKQLANLPMVRWFALQPPKMDKELMEKEQIVEELRTLIGWHGVTISRCNPSGKANINDRIFGVVSQDKWIDEDSEIEVVDIHENTLIVRQRA